MRSSIRKACCLVAGVVLLLPIGAAAQSIEMTNSDILLKNAGETTIFLEGNEGKAFFGGGDKYGDIILRDNDGTTTTIHLDGQLGFIQLGSPNEDGDLRLWDNSPDNDLSINLDGGSGNVSNQLGGNGLVKAWARINSSGTVASCYRCNVSAAATQRLFTGQYEVSFSPLGTDIRSRPRLATLGTLGAIILDGEISMANRSADNTSVFVATLDSAGTYSNKSFTIVIF